MEGALLFEISVDQTGQHHLWSSPTMPFLRTVTMPMHHPSTQTPKRHRSPVQSQITPASQISTMLKAQMEEDSPGGS